MEDEETDEGKEEREGRALSIPNANHEDEGKTSMFK